jgi:tetratricopeptide (TPR) repeat protein
MEPQHFRMKTMSIVLLILAITTAAAACQAVITPVIEQYVLRQKWDSAFGAIADDTNNVNDPVSRLLSVHCCIALNRNGDVHVLTDATFKPPQLKAWLDWTNDFLTRYPKNAAALYLLADATYRNGYFTSNFDSALNISADRATEAISADSTFAMAWLARGISYQYLKQYDKSIEDLSRAIKLRGDFAEAFFYRGLSFEQKGDLNAAVSDYSDALSKSKDFPRAWVFRGAVYREKGALDSALSDCDKALRYDPKYSIAYLVKAQTYEKMGRSADAIREYETFIKEAGEVWVPQIRLAKRQLEALKGK